MDPTQALINADQAISDLEYSQALIHLNSYAAWRFKGGFEPRHIPSIRSKRHGDEIFDSLMIHLATFVESQSA